MNKAIGILVIGLGLILIAIGVTGTQTQVLADIKSINPKLRQAVGGPSGNPTGGVTVAPVTGGGGNSIGPQNAGAAPGGA